MLIMGCDYHSSVQQIAWVDTETGEYGERRLAHRAEAEQFYRELKGRQARVGIEATGHSRWLERLLAEVNFEIWIGDPSQAGARAEERSAGCRAYSEADAEDDFPRIWAPTPENGDLRQLVWHRHRLVGMRTRVMNQLQAVAMNEGLRRKKGLWAEEGSRTARVADPHALDHSPPARIIGVTGLARSQHR